MHNDCHIQVGVLPWSEAFHCVIICRLLRLDETAHMGYVIQAERAGACLSVWWLYCTYACEWGLPCFCDHNRRSFRSNSRHWRCVYLGLQRERENEGAKWWVVQKHKAHHIKTSQHRLKMRMKKKRWATDAQWKLLPCCFVSWHRCQRHKRWLTFLKRQSVASCWNKDYIFTFEDYSEQFKNCLSAALIQL